MHRVGQAVRSAQGLVILRASDDTVDIGTVVLDDSLDEIGRVVDVFGPVEKPYLAVTPEESVHVPGLIGSTLYAR